ncbi:MAG TPA: M17 family peptidase N-terminal domain-containing protein [Polyangia bacterium]|nr:M17 family peptidase N-terminal domain-containing protein [Polyangia bacterium]
MNVSLLPVELARWDQAPPGDAVCVPVWTDVRPLRGAAGLLDWRLCGRLSMMLASGKVTGAEGEQTLFPTAHRLPWRLVLALGGGPRRDFSDRRFQASVRRALDAVRGLGARRLALALPGRDGERATTGATATLTSRRALDVVLEELDARPGVLDELAVIAPGAVQKELAEVLRLRVVRAAAPTGPRPAAPRRAPRPKP